MSVPIKKTKKASRSTRSRNTARTKDARAVQWAIEPRATVLGLTFVIFAVGAAALMAARHASREDTIAIPSAQTEAPAPSDLQPRPDQRASAAPRLEAKKTASPKASAPTQAADVHVTPTPAASLPSVEQISALPVTTATEPLADPSKGASAGNSTSAQAIQKVAAVTITGCLEHDDDAFWLTDTSGTGAPMSRSWKSGFLKKRPSRIELVDSAHALRLTSYVGQRIAATGTLVNREMQTHSLHRVAASCS
jgi:hypothetical protein